MAIHNNISWGEGGRDGKTKTINSYLEGSEKKRILTWSNGRRISSCEKTRAEVRGEQVQVKRIAPLLRL